MTIIRCQGGGLYSSRRKGEGYALCSVCGDEFKLRKDGTIRQHVRGIASYPWREPCPGVGQPPKEGA